MLIPRGTAILSECGLYRPWLTRDLGDPNGKVLVSIGANPSKADAMQDDPTMRREQDYGRRWGCGLFVKTNAYAYRATDPDDMWAAERAGVDIVGTDIRGLHNDDYIARAIRMVAERGGIVLCAWGKIPKRERVIEMLRHLDRVGALAAAELTCLGTNGDGSPKHTLYLKATLLPERWDLPAL